MPAIDILNSSNIVLNNVTPTSSFTPLLRIGGDRSAAIKFTNSDEKNIRQKSVFEFGAAENVLITQ